jgi:hypothetical protein
VAAHTDTDLDVKILEEDVGLEGLQRLLDNVGEVVGACEHKPL